ncbi:MAG: hypothetical protein J0H66_12980 [Solirubrobacterales bacterium]|nr:hypothetical protein [Solirubrobacterales bacterium]
MINADVSPPALGEPSKLFGRFSMDAGGDGAARERFQLFVTDLVKVKYPDATTVEGPGGRDWGIDTFAGQLAGGHVRIWQSKFVLEWQDDSPQGQVRSSFKSAIDHADEHGHNIVAWTLVVPCVLHPDQMKWFSGWADRTRRKHHIAIDLWDGTELRHQLLNADAQRVRREYFPFTIASGRADASRPPKVQRTADLAQFEDALFVRQLREAGQVETDSARAHFFATDALVRDYEAKSQTTAIDSMDELHMEVKDIWEQEFNKESPTADERGRMGSLIESVIERAAACDDPSGLPLAKAHKKGTAHRLVEKKEAGWVIHWREIADEHPTSVGTANPPSADSEVESPGEAGTDAVAE